MPPEWKLPATKCHLSSNGQDKRQARKSLFRTNRRTMETKKLRTKIFIQQQKNMHTVQHFRNMYGTVRTKLSLYI